MPLSLDEFSVRLGAIVKHQVELAARSRDDFQQRVQALLDEAKPEGEDLGDAHLAIFTDAMARMNAMIEEV